MRQFKHLFLALTVSALALAAVPASAGVAVTTTRVSVNSAGAEGNPTSGASSNLPISISATGRFVAFPTTPQAWSKATETSDMTSSSATECVARRRG